ncbi:hypothetical protein KJ903_05230 [Patescibacteria group bacterium]|nr:hypothetical protein [Patescibacteria group bacterium]
MPREQMPTDAHEEEPEGVEEGLSPAEGQGPEAVEVSKEVTEALAIQAEEADRLTPDWAKKGRRTELALGLTAVMALGACAPAMRAPVGPDRTQPIFAQAEKPGRTYDDIPGLTAAERENMSYRNPSERIARLDFPKAQAGDKDTFVFYVTKLEDALGDLSENRDLSGSVAVDALKRLHRFNAKYGGGKPLNYYLDTSSVPEKVRSDAWTGYKADKRAAKGARGKKRGTRYSRKAQRQAASHERVARK